MIVYSLLQFNGRSACRMTNHPYILIWYRLGGCAVCRTAGYGAEPSIGKKQRLCSRSRAAPSRGITSSRFRRFAYQTWPNWTATSLVGMERLTNTWKKWNDHPLELNIPKCDPPKHPKIPKKKLPSSKSRSKNLPNPDLAPTKFCTPTTLNRCE